MIPWKVFGNEDFERMTDNMKIYFDLIMLKK